SGRQGSGSACRHLVTLRNTGDSWQRNIGTWWICCGSLGGELLVVAQCHDMAEVDYSVVGHLANLAVLHIVIARRWVKLKFANG
ncbi:MAG: hypothetical protein ABIP80_01050, partial [Ferruginibacter sp.]